MSFPARLLLYALLALAASAGCGRVDCPALCNRVRQCRAAVTRALVARQPSQSRFMKHVRKQLPARIVPRLLASCPERCEALQGSRKWRQRLRACAAKKQCDEFARCIAPALEP